jgi:hypothetical protein
MHRLERLCPKVRAIVDTELNAGNLIEQIIEDWPRGGSLAVVLRYGFRGVYPLDDPALVYCEVPARTQWAAQYMHAKNRQIVACVHSPDNRPPRSSYSPNANRWWPRPRLDGQRRKKRR